MTMQKIQHIGTNLDINSWKDHWRHEIVAIDTDKGYLQLNSTSKYGEDYIVRIVQVSIAGFCKVQLLKYRDARKRETEGFKDHWSDEYFWDIMIPLPIVRQMAPTIPKVSMCSSYYGLAWGHIELQDGALVASSEHEDYQITINRIYIDERGIVRFDVDVEFESLEDAGDGYLQRTSACLSYDEYGSSWENEGYVHPVMLGNLREIAHKSGIPVEEYTSDEVIPVLDAYDVFSLKTETSVSARLINPLTGKYVVEQAGTDQVRFAYKQDDDSFLVVSDFSWEREYEIRDEDEVEYLRPISV